VRCVRVMRVVGMGLVRMMRMVGMRLVGVVVVVPPQPPVEIAPLQRPRRGLSGPIGRFALDLQELLDSLLHSFCRRCPKSGKQSECGKQCEHERSLGHAAVEAGANSRSLKHALCGALCVCLSQSGASSRARKKTLQRFRCFLVRLLTRLVPVALINVGPLKTCLWEKPSARSPFPRDKFWENGRVFHVFLKNAAAQRRHRRRRTAAQIAPRSGARRRAAPPEAGDRSRVIKEAFSRVACSRFFTQTLPCRCRPELPA
jgi:hypothetical protein